MSYMYLIEICHQERFLRLSGKYILFLLIFEMNFIKTFGTCYHKYTIVKKSKKNQQNTRVGVSLQQDSPIDVFFVCKYPMPQCNSGYINKYITILRFEIITRNNVFFSCTHYAWKEMKLPGETNSFLCYETTKKLCDEYNAIKVVELNFIIFLTWKWDIANRNGAYIIYRHEIVTE